MSGESQDSLVTYQIYWRSFSDSNGDGIGDIAGLVDRLDYVAPMNQEHAFALAIEKILKIDVPLRAQVIRV